MNTNKVTFGEVEAAKMAKVADRGFQLEIDPESGKMDFSIDTSDVSIVKLKSGLKQMIYQLKTGLKDFDEATNIVANGDELLNVKDIKYVVTVADNETWVVRNPAKMKGELAQCRKELRKLRKDGKWNLADLRAFIQGTDPTLKIRGKRYDDPAFSYEVNIASSKNVPDICTFREFCERVLVEWDSKESSNPVAIQAFKMIHKLPEYQSADLSNMDVLEQVEFVSGLMKDHLSDLMRLAEEEIAAKAAKKAKLVKA